MRQGVTLHIGGIFQTQEHPPQQHPIHEITPPSYWKKSPVPYLFGGFAAMLGLIAFALLMLACSYWKLSGHQDNAIGEETGGATSDEKPKGASTVGHLNSMLVIMAGDEKPTFLATPATSRVSSFGDTESSEASSSSGGCCGGGEDKEPPAVVVVDGDKR